MLTTNIGAEPIIPMAALIWKLGCDISWRQDELLIRHPRLGALPVKTKDGCPQVGKQLALDLIYEIEEKIQGPRKKLKKAEGKDYNQESQWIKDPVDTHPVFKDLPDRVKQRLPAEVGE